MDQFSGFRFSDPRARAPAAPESDAQILQKTGPQDRQWLSCPFPVMFTEEDFGLSRGQAANNELDLKVHPLDEGHLFPMDNVKPLAGVMETDADLTAGLMEHLLRNISSTTSLKTVFGSVFFNRVSIVKRLLLAKEREALRAAERSAPVEESPAAEDLSLQLQQLQADTPAPARSRALWCACRRSCCRGSHPQRRRSLSRPLLRPPPLLPLP